METRAPYVIVGAFVLAVVVAVFGFVYWLNNAGGIGARTTYRVEFNEPVPGLLVGAAVLFNGIRVGEVTGLALDPGNPRRVNVTLAVTPQTPVRADTKVGLDFQGLTGVPVVALEGGKDLAGPVPTAPLVASPGAGQSMTQAARDALRHIDGILTENAVPLRDTIANLDTFSGGLARNTGRLEGIVAGLERMTGGGEPPKPKQTYDLAAAKDFAAPKKELPAMVIADPTAVITLDTQRIVLKPNTDDAAFADAQWADNIPKLVQARLIQSFENYDPDHAPIRPTDGVDVNDTLMCDIRSFQIDTGPSPAAEVALSVRVVSKDGKILGSRVFEARRSIAKLDVATAVDATSQAFTEIASQLVPWAAALVAK